jgi:hypothetical protein
MGVALQSAARAGEQGIASAQSMFLTDSGEILDRIEAWKHAKKCGQFLLYQDHFPGNGMMDSVYIDTVDLNLRKANEICDQNNSAIEKSAAAAKPRPAEPEFQPDYAHLARYFRQPSRADVREAVREELAAEKDSK